MWTTATIRVRALAGLILFALGLLGMIARPSSASVQTITTCQAIGCPGRSYLCGSYEWGGPNPGSRDCYANPVVYP